jgi:hypothetical protein
MYAVISNLKSFLYGMGGLRGIGGDEGISRVEEVLSMSE